MKKRRILFAGPLFLLCLSSCNFIQTYHSFLGYRLAKHQIKRGVVQTSFGSHSFLHGGKGKKLIFIHGFGTNALESWNQQLPLFVKSGFEVFAPDLFWFGSQPAPGKLFRSVAEQVDAVVAWMKTQQIKKASFVGCSFGGYIAMLLAARYPHRVEKLVLIDAAGVKTNIEEEHYLKANFPYGHDYASILVPDSRKKLKVLFRGLLFRPLPVPNLVWHQMLEKSVWKNKEAKKRIARFLEKKRLSTKQLRQIKHPTLVLWGEHDRIFPLSIARRLTSMLPHATLKILAEAGHLPMSEQPQKVNQEILRFMRASNKVGNTN